MRASVMVLGAVVASLASSVASAQSGAPTIALTRSTYERGDIMPNQLRIAALRVDSIKLEQPIVHMRVGDTLSLDTVVVVAFDSAGKRIGRVRSFDSFLPRGAVIPAGLRHYLALAEGSAEATFWYPRSMWTGRADKPAQVTLRIDVTP